jgi:hypothetical protein
MCASGQLGAGSKGYHSSIQHEFVLFAVLSFITGICCCQECDNSIFLGFILKGYIKYGSRISHTV